MDVDVRREHLDPLIDFAWGESVLLIERGFEGRPPSNGIGVIGRSGTGTGVEASSESGLGLKVLGTAGFSSAGTGLVAAGLGAATVNDPNATLLSHITVTLTSDPGARHVRWVGRAAGSFTLHLTDAPQNKRPQTSFTYLSVEPAT